MLRPAHIVYLGWMQSEWKAVRHGSGVFDASFRALHRLTGEDRVVFLQGMVSNDIVKLQPEQGVAAALLTQQARLVSDLRVYALADEVWLDVPAERHTAVRAALEKFIVADDVEFAEGGEWNPLLCVEGPTAARTVMAVVGVALDDLTPYHHRLIDVDGEALRVVAASHGGETGFLLYGPISAQAGLRERLITAGAEPIGRETLDVLRIEAGIPWFGRDMDETTLVMEVGLADAISFHKGCYLGQEVVERVAARGQVQKKLVGLLGNGSTPPPPSARLLHEGKEAGWVTSSAWSPAVGQPIALGYVRRESWEEGRELQVDGGGTLRVARLPFYGALR